MPCRMPEKIVDEIRRVTHQDYRLIPVVANHGGDGEVGLGPSAYRIFKTGEPYAAAPTLDGQIRVAQYRNAMLMERISNLIFARHAIVIAKNRVAPGTKDLP